MLSGQTTVSENLGNIVYHRDCEIHTDTGITVYYFVQCPKGFIYQEGGRKKGYLWHFHYPDIKQLRPGCDGSRLRDYTYAMSWGREKSARNAAKKYGGQVVRIEFKDGKEISRQIIAKAM